MEPSIKAYLGEHYPDSPAFLYGSRADGYYNSGSDWDVGIICENNGVLHKGNVTFCLRDLRNLDKKAIRNVHDINLTCFAKVIVPIKKEEEVREIENRVKKHIASYILQTRDIDKNSVDPVVIPSLYFQEEILFNFFNKPRYLNLLQNKEALRKISESYRKILEEDDVPNNFNYIQFKKSDMIFNLSERTLQSLKRSPVLAFERISRKFEECVKSL